MVIAPPVSILVAAYMPLDIFVAFLKQYEKQKQKTEAFVARSRDDEKRMELEQRNRFLARMSLFSDQIKAKGETETFQYNGNKPIFPRQSIKQDDSIIA